jgi:3'-5' exonuclease
MSTLIVDIETVGEAWDDLDETTQTVLTRWIDTLAISDEERLVRMQELQDGLGFSPLTGSIVALGVYDLERMQGTVYYVSPHEPDADEVDGVFTYRIRSEADMLAAFWEGVQQYGVIVTFNGRAFDVPFLMHRSVIHDIAPTVDLLRYRYLTQQHAPYHVDVQDQLTFYGAMSKRPSLHLFCRAYGITSPKAGGVSGDDVAELFASGQCLEIAHYNARDLLATAALYERWQTYLAPPLFRTGPPAIDF